MPRGIWRIRCLGLFLFMAGWGGTPGPASATSELLSEQGEYEWRCRLSGAMATGRLYKARLPAEVFDGLRSFPLDARVVDQGGVVWPSMIWVDPERDLAVHVRATEEETLGDEAAGYSEKRYRVEPDPASGDIPVHNRIIVNIGGEDHIRRTEVWGGEGPGQLDQFVSGFFAERAPPFGVRTRSIDYPETRVPFISVRIYDNLLDQDSRLDWQRTEVAYRAGGDEEDDRVELELVSVDRKGPGGEQDALELVLDAGARNRPLRYMDLVLGRHGEAHEVRVFGCYEPDRPWRWVADGSYQELGGYHHARINLNRSDFRYLKVQIRHPGERPPTFRKAEALAPAYYLLFTPLSDDTAHLYFGSRGYDLPSSDFARRINAERVAAAEEVSVAKRQVNPVRVAETLGDYRKSLLEFGFGVILMLAALGLLRFIRQRYLAG